jgi:hypothetical protein
MSHGKPLCETVMESRGWPSGTFARIVAGEFTNYERTTIKARFELRWWSFQLLDGHESSDSDPCIRRGNVERAASVDAGRPNRAAVAHAAAVDSLSARAL